MKFQIPRHGVLVNRRFIEGEIYRGAKNRSENKAEGEYSEQVPESSPHFFLAADAEEQPILNKDKKSREIIVTSSVTGVKKMTPVYRRHSDSHTQSHKCCPQFPIWFSLCFILG